MDQRAEISDFLRSRRGRVTPEQVGLIPGSRRRVTGLRREEVALLAGVSVDYYAKMERGDLHGVSSEVLIAVADALRLDEAETDHLINLARRANPEPRRRHREAKSPPVRPELQRFLDAVTGAPMWVRDESMTLVAANPLGRALYGPLLDDPVNENNTARFLFLNASSRTFFPDWEQGADDIVATMRTYAGQNPHNKPLTNLIGELITRSDAFGARWAAHNVRHHRTGIKRLNHPEVGLIELAYEALDLPANPAWHAFAYTAPLGSPSAEKIMLLASLSSPLVEEAGSSA